MNKRLIGLFSVLFVLIIALIIQKCIPSIAFNLGKQSYENKDYVKAFSLLKFANEIDSKNIEYRYYYVETMLKLKPTLDIQKELFKVSQANLSDTADLLSDKQIEIWRNNIFLNVGENYIEQTPMGDKILRWDAQTFPLKVYIKKDTSNPIPPYYESAITRAFRQWQNTGPVKFKILDNEKDANILVDIVSSQSMQKCDGPDCKYVVAFTKPTYNDSLLKRMDITFYDLNMADKPYSEREIYNTALHEIGHSLGIMGHSQNSDDLMYMQKSKEEALDRFRSDFQYISPRDANTLNLLYKLVPDITNTSMSKYNVNYQFYAPIIIGGSKEANSKKLTEAQNYIKQAPNLPNGYIDLASAYTELKEYSKAIDSLNTALNKTSDSSQRYLIYYNLAVIYITVKDWNNAIQFAQTARNIQDSPDLDGLIALANYNCGDKDKAKNEFAHTLAKSPDNKINAMNLAIIYLKEYNFPQAGKVLNNYVKANPEAANDPDLAPFKLIMFFFK